MLSILREAEYKSLGDVVMRGKILDIGGNIGSEYQRLVKGEHSFVSANVEPEFGADLVFDIQKPFPIESASFDGALCLNVLEHVYGFEDAVRETYRVLRPGGMFVFSTPFMHHIHGCPDDYFRYTDSALKQLLSEAGFREAVIKPLGGGLFSVIYQSISGALPSVLKPVSKSCAKFLDRVCSVSARYRRAAERMPLGYFVIAKKL